MNEDQNSLDAVSSPHGFNYKVTLEVFKALDRFVSFAVLDAHWALLVGHFILMCFTSCYTPLKQCAEEYENVLLIGYRSPKKWVWIRVVRFQSFWIASEGLKLYAAHGMLQLAKLNRFICQPITLVIKI